jgi:Glycerol-3-phosphate dehydrogenase
MGKILIIGGGAMGFAFFYSLFRKQYSCYFHRAHIIKIFIKNLNSKKKFHPFLKLYLPKKLKFVNYSKEIFKKRFDLIVIALSLAGIDFIGKEFKDLNIKTPLLVLTKGLKFDKKKKRILTISYLLKNNYRAANVSVLKGPCLAKELANKNKTSVVVANKNIKIAKWIGKLISTKYYLTEFSKDITGIEICSAIKNIYAMVIGSGQNLNAKSDLFQKSANEMKFLIKYFKGDVSTILGLAGIGDLYVSAIGGRNSKMGNFLGKGFKFTAAKKKFMPKDTVEGEQLAREIAP